MTDVADVPEPLPGRVWVMVSVKVSLDVPGPTAVVVNVPRLVNVGALTVAPVPLKVIVAPSSVTVLVPVDVNVPDVEY